MSAQSLTRANLSTALYDPEEDKTLFRLSLWVDAEDCEIVEDDPDKPTLRVEVKRGRFTTRGSIDRNAYKTWLLKDKPVAATPIPMPTSAEPTFRERMYR